MHRIDTPTAQKDKFGAGKNGFTAGNPQTGTPATDLDNDYFDMLQEELAGVVEATGVNLDKSKHNQLLTALKALLLSRAHPFADIKADGPAAIAEALSNLGLGTAAKREVGMWPNQIPDMGFFQAIAVTGNTLLKFPFVDQYGNAKTIMVQFVTIQTTGGTDKGYPLPYAFPSMGLFATGNRATSGYNAAMNVRIANATTVSIQNWGNAGALEDCCVIAVGL